MRAIFTFYLVLIIVAGSHAQISEQEKQAVVAEGFLLYKMELASWNASDLLMAISNNELKTLDSIRGYLSYRQGKSYSTIFFGGENYSRVYANFVFDSLLTVKTAVMDVTPRKTGKKELELITLRMDALERIANDEKEFYKLFEKTSFNLIPLITEKERKVVVLTGPQETGNVLFGNDYVLQYTEDNKFKSQTSLHRDLITVPMEAAPDMTLPSPSGSLFATVHNHVSPTSEYMTSTDICTLLLYGEYTNWKQHYVISDKFFSIWDMKSKSLNVISKKAIDKIYEDQEKKKTKD